MAGKYRKPYRVKKKKSIFRNRFFWLGVLTFIISGGIFYLVFFASIFQIKEIKISGNQRVPREELENVIWEQIGQKIISLSSKSIFLVNFGKMDQKILEKYPQIAQLSLKREFPNRLAFKIEERLPVGVWCPNENCFLIDKEGVIFKESLESSGLVIKSERLEEGISLGKKVIEKDYLEKILKLKKDLTENLKIEPKEFGIVPGRLEVKTSEGWEIYFDPKGDINWRLAELDLLLEKEIPLEKRGKLEYIDLRFTKVYYKYR